MHTPKNIWRLLLSPPGSGAWNMAVDEALLEAVSDGSAPTLRLYDWRPACLSLGYGQPFRDVDEQEVQARGWDVVRRPTGGRAILHVDELTYSVIAPVEHPIMKGGILSSYRLISGGLLEGLKRMAVPAAREEKYKLASEIAPAWPICFEVPSSWEITMGGKKMIGSAQVRRKDGVLQHGTLPLHGDLARVVQVLAFPDSDARLQAAGRLLSRATTVQGAVGRRVPWAEAAQAIADGFSSALGIHFERAAISPDEKSRAEELAAEKYGNPRWTRRRL